MKWWNWMPWILVFWMFTFKPVFSLSSFSFIKRLFSFFSLYAIRVVSSAYLKLLIFLLAILIPACASSSQIFHTMYSAYKLNKQNDSIQPWHTSFPIWNQSIVPCLVLIVVSWPNLWCILKVILTLALNHKDIVKSGRWDCSFCFCCCCLITLWMKVFTMNEVVWL